MADENPQDNELQGTGPGQKGSLTEDESTAAEQPVSDARAAVAKDVSGQLTIITRLPNGFKVSIPHIKLGPGEKPLTIKLKLKKLPTEIMESRRLGDCIIDIEKRNSPQVEALLAQARQLKKLPERERPRALVNLIRANITYKSRENMDKLAAMMEKATPEERVKIQKRLKWAEEKWGKRATALLSITEVIENGIGVCGHFSALAVVLGREAGLPGTLTSMRGNVMQNIIRKDTKKTLFDPDPPGVSKDAHAAAELLMSDGEWMPVDAAVKNGLVGDNPQELEMFKEAKYLDCVMNAITDNIHLMESGFGIVFDPNKLVFAPGESEMTAILSTRPQKENNIFEGPFEFTLERTGKSDDTDVSIESLEIVEEGVPEAAYHQ